MVVAQAAMVGTAGSPWGSAEADYLAAAVGQPVPSVEGYLSPWHPCAAWVVYLSAAYHLSSQNHRHPSDLPRAQQVTKPSNPA